MPEATLPPNIYVTYRLWSEEVGIAAASDGMPDDPGREPGYEFSSGIKFYSGQGPYANTIE